MKVDIRIKNENWKRDLQEASMNTVNKNYSEAKELTPDLFERYLISEHSPIRGIELRISLLDIPSANSVHFSRHSGFNTHYVSTNRPDRTKKERSLDNTNNHIIDINLQSLIDMSRKRLCAGKCDAITYKIMLEIKKFFMKHEDNFMKVIGEVLVPNCIYRNGCPEFKACNVLNIINNFIYKYLLLLTFIT